MPSSSRSTTVPSGWQTSASHSWHGSAAWNSLSGPSWPVTSTTVMSGNSSTSRPYMARMAAALVSNWASRMGGGGTTNTRVSGEAARKSASTRSKSLWYSSAVSSGDDGVSVRSMQGVMSLPAKDSTSTRGDRWAMSASWSSRSHTPMPPYALTSAVWWADWAWARNEAWAWSANESPTRAMSRSSRLSRLWALSRHAAAPATTARTKATPGSHQGGPRRPGIAGGGAGVAGGLHEGELGLAEGLADRGLGVAQAGAEALDDGRQGVDGETGVLGARRRLRQVQAGHVEELEGVLAHDHARGQLQELAPHGVDLLGVLLGRRLLLGREGLLVGRRGRLGGSFGRGVGLVALDRVLA